MPKEFTKVFRLTKDECERLARYLEKGQPWVTQPNFQSKHRHPNNDKNLLKKVLGNQPLKGSLNHVNR